MSQSAHIRYHDQGNPNSDVKIEFYEQKTISSNSLCILCNLSLSEKTCFCRLSVDKREKKPPKKSVFS